MAVSPGTLRAGKATIEFSLLKDKFSKELKTLQAKLNMVGDRFQSLGKIALGAGGLITGAFAGATKIFTGVGDTLNDMATRTGFAATTLSALDYAVGQTGTSLDAVEKAARGMARNILDAERGLSTATDNFRDLGIELNTLKSLSPDQQFLLIADWLSKVEDPTRRAALAMKIFGRAGTELLPMLQSGEKGISALVDEAHRLGVVMSTEDVEAAAKLDDAFKKLQAQLKQVFVQIGAAIAGDLQNFSERMIGLGRTVIDWTRENRALIATVAKIGVVVTATGAALFAFGTIIKTTAAAVGILSGAFTLLTAHPLIAAGTLLAAATLAVAKYSGAWDRLVDVVNRFTGIGPGFVAQINRVTDATNKAAEATKRLSIEEQIAAKHREMMEFAGMPKTLARLRKEMAQLEASKAAFDAATNKPSDDPMEFGVAVTLDNLRPGLDFLRRKLRELQDEAIKIFAPDMPELKASLQKTAAAGVRAAVEVRGGGVSIATFDTRLSRQMFGGSDLERDQLNELKAIRKVIQNRRGGLPVV
jgi:hypothetical protein